MGDSRDLCPHLDSIGEVTKEDLLFKSKVKGQTLQSGAHVQGHCVPKVQVFPKEGLKELKNRLPNSLCLAFCVNGRAGVCGGSFPGAAS